MNQQQIHDQWKKHITHDFQKRCGYYPKSNIPDSIDVFKTCASIYFKNTTEKTAKRWVEDFIHKNNLPYSHISTSQAGDYQDDWVEVEILFVE